MTDFVVGQTYEFKKPVYLLKGSLMTLRQREPADSEGVIFPGARLVVRKVVVFQSREVGTTTEVYAEILTGEHKAETVSVSQISQILKTGYTQRDPATLQSLEP